MIYKLDTEIDDFMTLDLDPISLAEQLIDQLPESSQYKDYDSLISMIVQQTF